eukprot:3803943-Amphidinium_carterae.1
MGAKHCGLNRAKSSPLGMLAKTATGFMSNTQEPTKQGNRRAAPLVFDKNHATPQKPQDDNNPRGNLELRASARTWVLK